MADDDSSFLKFNISDIPESVERRFSIYFRVDNKVVKEPLITSQLGL